MFDWNVKFFGAHLQQVKNNWEMPIESHIGFEVNLILEEYQETIMEKNRYQKKLPFIRQLFRLHESSRLFQYWLGS
ncbi:hypothetical protein QFZ80_004720 [Paenibacillus sp. V4I7]|nr:hypothetical protein [Paenibacillus sp. V4I7]